MSKSLTKFGDRQAQSAVDRAAVELPLPLLAILEDTQSAFFGLCVTAGKQVLEAMMEADRLRERARFAPYIAGEELTLADFGAAIHLPLVSNASKAIYGEDLLEALPAVRWHREIMGERESLKRVKADRRNDVPRFAEHQRSFALGSTGR